MQFNIKDISLASAGRNRAEWAEREMGVLRSIYQRFSKEKPLKGISIAACLHVTAETANLAKTLLIGGAKVSLCASNVLSTQDDVAAHLVESGVSVFAIQGEDTELYYKHMNTVIDTAKPNITIDDGADLVAILHKHKRHFIPDVIGGMEETTTGVIRLNALHREGKLMYPIIAVNSSMTKHMFDNRYGTGQSTLDGIIRATNILITGKTVVVIGYGWCGRGLAASAKGMGAHTVVCEVNPVRALEAVMDGHRVMPIMQAASIGDIFVTVTGGIKAIDKKHFELMKDGAVVANSGHFDVEINLPSLRSMTETSRDIRENVKEHRLENGKKVYVLAEGRLVNLSAAEGHPASVMDMSFANQALAGEYIIKNRNQLNKGVHTLPKDIDNQIAQLKLESMNMFTDTLTEEQTRYLNSWEMGT